MMKLKQAVFVCAITAISLTMIENVKGEDFSKYIKTSKDFQRVPQKKAMLLSKHWDHWIYMPWRYRWGRKYDEDCAVFLKNAGINGGYCDYQPDDGDGALHEKNDFLWYMDHTAGKGDLYLRKKNLTHALEKSTQRPRCLVDPVVVNRLKSNIKGNVTRALKYKTRIAYALDDEISWSSFTSPCRWDNNPLSLADFARWLNERYGSEAKLKKEWLGFAPAATKASVNWGSWKAGRAPSADYVKRMLNLDDLQGLYKKPMDKWNLSAWCDAMSYMDSQFCNLIGDLVEYSNTIDPDTPCGFVGTGTPSAYGGYDFAKVMRKIQFHEAYDVGCAMEIGRSLNPKNEMPAVRTLFGDPSGITETWYCWYYLVHGDRGIITWAEDWFKEGKVTESQLTKAGKEIQKIAKVSKKLIGGKWLQNEVAIYYSHPSIQVSWFIDCEPHGKTWIKRKSSMNNSFSSTVAVGWAWQKLLEDYGVQYNWITYASLLENGISPKQYKVLILPRIISLSKDEADVIRTYVKNGGHVIADYQTGIFDEHGKAYPDGKGIIDDLLGVENRPAAKPGSMFFGKIFGEIDADAYYDKDNFINAGAQTWPQCEKTKEGFTKAQLDMGDMTFKKTGKGWGVHLNASIVEYALIRKTDFAKCAKYAEPITNLLSKIKIKPWVSLSVNGKNPSITEAVFWKNNGRIYVCIVKNPLRFASEFGATDTDGITDKIVKLAIKFKGIKKDVVNELTGKKYGKVKHLTVSWQENKAVILSFKK